MRGFKITESQYNAALAEGLLIKADVDGANGDVNQAIQNSKQQAIRSGVNLDDATFAVDADDTNESKVLSIKDIKRKYLHEDKIKNSKLLNVRDFINTYCGK